MTAIPDSFPDLHIHSSLADYRVGFSTAKDLSGWRPNADLLVIDSFFRSRLTIPTDLPVIWIEANEESKSLEKTLPLFVNFKQAGLSRSSRIVAVGGGVVQDIATFVASLFMRGIQWNYIPTTFLGMTDSCVGGKSSINAGPYKNLVGNFHPPELIDIMPVFARTLPAEEIMGGAAEAAKICFCRGASSFKTYERLAQPILTGFWDEAQLADLLRMVLEVKKWFIEIDEFDQAERRLLNFGHTWGHALESATGYSIPHGLAVALGMMASIEFTQHQISTQSLWSHCLKLLNPVLKKHQINSFDPESFIKAFEGDKKHSPGYYHLIVPKDANESPPLGVKEIQLSANKDSMNRILKSMIEILKRFQS